MLTAERLREVLNYDPMTGQFTWLPRPVRAHMAHTDKCWNAVHVGTVAGGLYKENGYLGICVDGRKYLAHRLVWLWMFGRWPMGGVVHGKGGLDHVNLDKSDNRLVNLREATSNQNMHNRRAN